MPPTKFTDTIVRSIEPTSQRKEHPDSLVPGLYLVVQPSGKKSWAVRYRIDRRTVKYTLGPYPKLTLAEARDKGRDALVKAAKGEDPAGSNAVLRHEKLRTVDGLAEHFLAKQAENGRRSVGEQRRILERDILPKWRGLYVTTISRQRVQNIVDEKARTAPIMANRILALLSRLFNFAIGLNLIQTNPAAHVQEAKEEKARERVLKAHEVKKIWGALEAHGWPFEPIVKLLFITGQRKEEVAGLRWDELEMSHKRWFLPAARSKNKCANEVPLGPMAMRLIRALPRFEGTDLVFPSNSAKSRSTRNFSGFSKKKRELDEVLGILDWRFQDIRRTMRSELSGLGIPREVSERLVNHQTGAKLNDVEATYDRYHYRTPKRKAMMRWEKRLHQLVE